MLIKKSQPKLFHRTNVKEILFLDSLSPSCDWSHDLYDWSYDLLEWCSKRGLDSDMTTFSCTELLLRCTSALMLLLLEKNQSKGQNFYAKWINLTYCIYKQVSLLSENKPILCLKHHCNRYIILIMFLKNCKIMNIRGTLNSESWVWSKNIRKYYIHIIWF